jgi:hypothetical protein
VNFIKKFVGIQQSNKRSCCGEYLIGEMVFEKKAIVVGHLLKSKTIKIWTNF